MPTKILVTGGLGYIGSHTVVELQNAGYEIVIVDDLSNSNINVLDGIEKITSVRPIFEQINCTNLDALKNVFEKYVGIKGIIHFAASKAVGESIEKPLLYYRNNLVSLINLLDLMPAYEVEGFVFSSSATVYGQPPIENLPVTENSPIQLAQSPYANTKQIAEEIVHDAVAARMPIKTILLRYFNPIGAHKSAEIGELPLGIPQNLLPYLVQVAVGIRPELSVYGNDYNTPDGSCIRDYIDVIYLAKAHVSAIERIISNKQKNKLECFNLGTGKGISVLEMITAFENATGAKIPYKIVGRRTGDIEQIWADSTLANDLLGWHAETPLEDTLKSAYAWAKKINIKNN